jgi:hypothetical protein
MLTSVCGEGEEITALLQFTCSSQYSSPNGLIIHEQNHHPTWMLVAAIHFIITQMTDTEVLKRTFISCGALAAAVCFRHHPAHTAVE